MAGERIRDKQAASKAKGMWMGGIVPLGYNVVDKKLRPHPTEAATVLHIFERYHALGSCPKLLDEFARDGIRTAVRPDRGGRPFARQTLVYLLRNRTYVGEITYHDNAYPSIHRAIVPRPLFDSVQRRLVEEELRREAREDSETPRILDGKLRDAFGRSMSPRKMGKAGRRYRYWVTDGKGPAGGGEAAQRIAGFRVERAVTKAMWAFLGDKERLAQLLIPPQRRSVILERLFARAGVVRERLKTSAKRRTLDATIASVNLDRDRTRVVLDRAGCARILEIPDTYLDELPEISAPPLSLRRCPDEPLLDYRDSDRARDEALIALLGEAREVRRLVGMNTAASLAELAEARGVGLRHFERLLRIAGLAPDLVLAILDGRHPAGLTAPRLLKLEVPTDWDAQKRVLGFLQSEALR